MNELAEEGNTRQDRATAFQPALAIVGTAFVSIAVLVFRGNSCGDDFDFHLLSWMETARSWQSGIWYPHWIHLANYGAGEPRLVFYPPASWMLGGLLGRLSSWNAAPILFVLVALVASGWSMYRLAQQWVGRGAATVAACLYTANPYALFVIYQRSALAELLAGVWIPLIVLYALKRDSPVAALALAVAAVWLTDAPVAVIASYLLALLAVGMTLIERKAWPALRAADGMALGLGLAAFYIVPALYEQRWVEIQRSMAPGMRVADSFLFMRTGDSYHDHVLRIASWIVCLEIAAAAIAAWQGWRLVRVRASLSCDWVAGTRATAAHRLAPADSLFAVPRERGHLESCAVAEVHTISLALADGCERGGVHADRLGAPIFAERGYAERGDAQRHLAADRGGERRFRRADRLRRAALFPNLR